MDRFHKLILDDDRLCLGKLSNILTKHNFKVYCASTPSRAFNILEYLSIDFFFCDISLPEMSGLEILSRFRHEYPDMDVIMISGENGTGKEIIARIIHHTSDRKSKVFFPVNCAAVPETLIESEFFGHKKGGFYENF